MSRASLCPAPEAEEVTGGFFSGRAPELTDRKTLDNRHWTEDLARPTAEQIAGSIVYGPESTVSGSA